MKKLIIWIGKLLGPRAELKAIAACNNNENVFNILHNDYQWRKTRNTFIKYQPFCEMCGIERDLQVHHIKPWHLAEELRYDFNNLMTLCQSCHFRFGHWRNWKHYNKHIIMTTLKIKEIKYAPVV